MELVREGTIEAQQLEPFGPVFFKHKKSEDNLIN
jgi:chromatin segregation and condensation protein Rec8/ScpA/Scc1 (kleisin family)